MGKPTSGHNAQGFLWAGPSPAGRARAMASLAKEKGKYYRVHWKFTVSG